ncbi:MAG: hypothetical protein KDB80_17965 [Planctomycetes bacterium]|nr:hypothetical protein [Planctomycetota bacterium]
MHRSDERGISLVELSIAAAVVTIVLFLITSNSMSGVAALRSMARVTSNSTRAGEIVHGIEKRVRGGTGFRPAAWIVTNIGASGGIDIEVDSVRGFPNVGLLVAEPGTSNVEFIRYNEASSNAVVNRFGAIERNQRGYSPRSHAAGAALRWAPSGEVLSGTPSPGTFDGQSVSSAGSVYFRGEATGFVFQRSLVIGATRQLGSLVHGTPTPDGWNAIYYEPVSTIREADRGYDLNHDGDKSDTFDLGQLRLRTWSPIGTSTQVDDIPISPTSIVQETNAWGRADLDGDGMADPMFLWHDASSKLQIQLVVWTGHEGRQNQFLKVESAVRLSR